ncbi:hypothetical protein EKO27_g7508 [Xylaria grammica]|uniref:2EXR domain-containing protein n=1 Tax=Xylaria grammica TaxID=363999 RepID=A0A439CZF1_9PEZI|nr:hypothetical protein EKO27_g7508 [Xylaria grammica]
MSDPNRSSFNRLPEKVRLAIWENFALPRRPLFHSISYAHHSERYFMLFTFDMTGDDKHSERDRLLRHSTTRALMQVNREARKTVLAGRELQRVAHTNMNVCVGCTYGSISPVRPGLYGFILQKFFYVNWDIDMFYFRCGLHISNPLEAFLDKSCLPKMKQIAIDIRGPSAVGNNYLLKAPTYKRIFGVYSDPYWTFAQNLPSLNTILMVVDRHTSRKLWGHSTLDEDEWEGPLVPDQDVDSDAGNNYGERDSTEGEDDEWMYLEWIESYPKDEFGFHRFSPEFYDMELYRRLFCLVRQQLSVDKVKVPFKEWVEEIVSSAKEDAKEALGRPIDIQMVMDHLGSYDNDIGGYHRLDKLWEKAVVPRPQHKP